MPFLSFRSTNISSLTSVALSLSIGLYLVCAFTLFSSLYLYYKTNFHEQICLSSSYLSITLCKCIFFYHVTLSLSITLCSSSSPSIILLYLFLSLYVTLPPFSINLPYLFLSLYGALLPFLSLYLIFFYHSMELFFLFYHFTLPLSITLCNSTSLTFSLKRFFSIFQSVRISIFLSSQKCSRQ